ncbi:MAG: tRNA glutamyl-Q(34) synthetase GluQRS [Gemmataceae bacterium]|nr:tRNA glutamyl-Q(34) synthetase GluQRS [Gemmataceae bacterium]
MTTNTKVVGRLAPSPTGAQHLGNARTYLIAWLSARSQGGRMVLRIEDIDASRVRPGAIESAIDDLRWLGLHWDGELIVQTQRVNAHRDALDRLKALELVYPCTCTRSDIERAASAPHAENEGPIYPGLCAHRRASDAESLAPRPFAWRMRTTNEAIPFDDGLRGPVALNLHQIGGDFVVWKNDDSPAYQLAVVVDDADAGVTEVIRGDDLIPSTPRQLLLYRALGHDAPKFVHVPLVIDEDARRLAKRHGDTRLSLLREAGVAPEAVLGLLAWSCGWIDEVVPIRSVDLLGRYRLDAIPREPFVLTREILTKIGFPA